MVEVAKKNGVFIDTEWNCVHWLGSLIRRSSKPYGQLRVWFAAFDEDQKESFGRLNFLHLATLKANMYLRSRQRKGTTGSVNSWQHEIRFYRDVHSSYPLLRNRRDWKPWKAERQRAEHNLRGSKVQLCSGKGTLSKTSVSRECLQKLQGHKEAQREEACLQLSESPNTSSDQDRSSESLCEDTSRTDKTVQVKSSRGHKERTLIFTVDEDECLRPGIKRHWLWPKASHFEGYQIKVSRRQNCNFSVEPYLVKVQIGFRGCSRPSVYVRHTFSIFIISLSRLFGLKFSDGGMSIPIVNMKWMI